jgi:hypothetical protein
MAAQRTKGHPPSWWVALRIACVRRRPTLPPRLRGSTIGAGRLSFRVRNGTGRFPLAMAAGTLLRCGVVPDRISGTAQWTQHDDVLVKSSAY